MDGSSMRRLKVVRHLISLIGALLGLWLTLGGLELRILGTYLTWHQQIILFAYPEQLFGAGIIHQTDVAALGWPMVVFGSSWGGALVGFWIGERWAVPAMLLLSVLALPFPYPGTALGLLLVILILTTPQLRQSGNEQADAARI
jgi:hypothetical protein